MNSKYRDQNVRPDNQDPGEALTKVVDRSHIVAERMLPTIVASRTFFLP
jgi:hypothetical protein